VFFSKSVFQNVKEKDGVQNQQKGLQTMRWIDNLHGYMQMEIRAESHSALARKSED